MEGQARHPYLHVCIQPRITAVTEALGSLPPSGQSLYYFDELLLKSEIAACGEPSSQSEGLSVLMSRQPILIHIRVVGLISDNFEFGLGEVDTYFGCHGLFVFRTT